MICSIGGCSKPVKAMGWCAMHYSRWGRHGDPLWERPAPPEQCQADGCFSEPKSRGFCHKHYTRWLRHGDLVGKQPRDPLETRFWRRVVKSEGCWEWQPPLSSSGYGIIRGDGCRTYAHRYSYQLHFGALTPEMNVCHRCDNPP